MFFVKNSEFQNDYFCNLIHFFSNTVEIAEEIRYNIIMKILIERSIYAAESQTKNRNDDV